MATMQVQPDVAFRTLTVNAQDGLARKNNQNSITTTKYTWYSWLPKSVWEQFRRIANVYFLLISILMLIGTYATYLFLTPLDPYSTVFTLVFVLMVTSLKEGSEDLQRARSDQFENNREVTIVTFDAHGTVVETLKKSKDVAPGDIVKMTGLTQVPVDLLLILTSMHNDGNKCYIETANIDGETNLKVKEGPALLLEHFANLINNGKATPELFTGSMEFEGPNKNIHNFIGTLKLAGAAEAIPLSTENLILRSSLFSNTDWGYGIAVYTGQETKIQMNNRHAPSKMSKLEGNLNTAILIIFVAQFVLVTLRVASIYFMGFDNLDKLPYVYPPGDGNGSVLPLWLEQWFVFFLLYNNFIPISLYVTIELVNVGQAYLIGVDDQMYREELDVACTVRASNLVQELGMVSNIFSDKTGTLTRNEMKLVKFVVDGRMFDIDYSLISAVAAEPASSTRKDGQLEQSVGDSKKDEHHKMKHRGGVKESGDGPAKILKQFGSMTPSVQSQFADFFRCLTACHTVVREKSGTYRAESPDELALVEGVAPYRCNLLERGSKEMNVEILGEKKTFEVLAVNPFNADRKRMSLLVKDVVTMQYYVMCKGADNIMLPLCLVGTEELSQVNQSLLDLANMGLRTLVIAQKELEEREALAWLAKYKAATVSTVNRDDNIAKAGGELELGMQLLGITAIEDRLQDEVPEVIADLAKAGIILWMLTGDKLETAINIGHSCNLLLEDTVVSMLTKINSPSEFDTRLREEFEKITKEPTNPNTALVIDGPSFTHFDDRDLEQRKMMLRIGAGCRSVIACRLTPTQKRELVKLVKTDTVPKATTLAIGDGANDVSMILEGDVGVGIFGKEGRQAANNADFAIGEFKFLRRLLLVHGRWNYIRQSKVFLYCMHKNMVLTLTLFWFSYYDAVSGTSPYESWVYTGFNFILGLPIIFYGIFDRDISADFCLAHPQTYSTGRTNSQLNVLSIARWIFNAVIYSVVLCLMAYYVCVPTFQEMGIYEAGTIVFVALCMALQAKVAFFHHQWSYIHFTSMAISVGGMLLYFLAISSSTDTFYYVAEAIYGYGIFWFMGMFSIPLFAVLIDVVGYNFYVFFWPTPEILMREMELADEFTPLQELTCLRHQQPSNGGSSSGNRNNSNSSSTSKKGHNEHVGSATAASLRDIAL